MDESESLHDPHTFLVAAPVWFIATDPDATTPADVAKSLSRWSATGPDGNPIVAVEVFTDADLAERRVESMPAGRAFAIRYPVGTMLRRLLVSLRKMGVAYVVFDPGANRAHPVPIEAVLKGFRT